MIDYLKYQNLSQDGSTKIRLQLILFSYKLKEKNNLYILFYYLFSSSNILNLLKYAFFCMVTYMLIYKYRHKRNPFMEGNNYKFSNKELSIFVAMSRDQACKNLASWKSEIFRKLENSGAKEFHHISCD